MRVANISKAGAGAEVLVREEGGGRREVLLLVQVTCGCDH